MATQPVAPSTEIALSGQPTLAIGSGAEQKVVSIHKTPFLIGRRPDNDLVLSDPRVSREHARIESEDGRFFLQDSGSRHGTFINGTRVERQVLSPDDRIEFGAEACCAVFHAPEMTAAPEEISEPVSLTGSSGFPALKGKSDLETLSLFLEAARRLSSSGVLHDVLVTLVDTTLRLTGAERGFVFLRESDGSLRLAAGRDNRGQLLDSDKTISRSILEDTVRSASGFVITDTAGSSQAAQRNSIIAHDLRTVICIPLHSRAWQQPDSGASAFPASPPETAKNVRGALYLDSRFVSGDLSGISHEILGAIAQEAANLVDNAFLVEAEEQARKYRQELEIAAGIHKNLMAVRMPKVPFARLRGESFPCSAIGGDFFDAVQTSQDVTVVIADVSGKGISAALLASILQGMIYTLLVAGRPLDEVAVAVNQFLCDKELSGKYATILLARLSPDGTLEVLNCGHVPPFLASGSGIASRLTAGDLPVGLFPDARFTPWQTRLNPGERLVLVTDGITEAANRSGEMFGYERLQRSCCDEEAFSQILDNLRQFRAGSSLADDCTLVEMLYTGGYSGIDFGPA